MVLCGTPMNAVRSCATSSARVDFSIAPLNEPFIACANTARNTTRARPIMSAAAVAAVRLGLRPALSRARRPLVGASFSSGQPMTRAAGRTMYLASIAMATKRSSAPRPMERSRLLVVPSLKMP